MKIGTAGFIVIALAITFLLIAALFVITPTTAPDQLPIILGVSGSTILIISKLTQVEAKTDTSIAASRENAHSLAAIVPSVGEAVIQATAAVVAVADNTATTEATHASVNGQVTEFKQALVQMAALYTEIAAQKAEIATLVATADHHLAIIAAHAAGVVAGRAQTDKEDAS